jgi:hypothetical protein
MTNIKATITIIKITTMNSTNLKIIKIMLTITSWRMESSLTLNNRKVLITPLGLIQSELQRINQFQ